MSDTPGKSKIYTRTGDKGETGLFGGARVAKDDPRVEAYGTVDELNANIGVAVSFLNAEELSSLLRSIQNDLFDIGAELSSAGTVRRDAQTAFRLSQDKAKPLEKAIDRYDNQLPALRTFILPSGSKEGSILHLARTVCRRAERAVVALSHAEEVNQNIIVYLNRLSDLLFVLARYANMQAGFREDTWTK